MVPTVLLFFRDFYPKEVIFGIEASFVIFGIEAVIFGITAITASFVIGITASFVIFGIEASRVCGVRRPGKDPPSLPPTPLPVARIPERRVLQPSGVPHPSAPHPTPVAADHSPPAPALAPYW